MHSLPELCTVYAQVIHTYPHSCAQTIVDTLSVVVASMLSRYARLKDDLV